MDIAIVINSFNRFTLLKECLKVLALWIPDSLFQERCMIVIYDAGSTDGTIEWLQDEAGTLGLSITLILPKEGDDTSFAAGLNTGVAHAEEILPNLRYLLFYETDNQILTPTPLLQALEQIECCEDLAACGFTVRYHNGKTAGVGMLFPKLLNFALGQRLVHTFGLEQIPYKWTSNNGISFSELDVVFTSPLLVKLEAWKESGGLDEKLFPFSDCDIDWAKRLKKLGWRMGVIQSDDVIHDNGQELSAWSKSRAQHFHRARLRYFRRYHPHSTLLFWPHLLIIRHFFELMAASVFVYEPKRRKHLIEQFSNLLQSSFRQYN